jgi:hypothetical protein
LKISKKNRCLYLTERHAIQICGEMELKVHKLLNSAAVGSESDKLLLLAAYPP